jgi:hypothetical protein
MRKPTPRIPRIRNFTIQPADADYFQAFKRYCDSFAQVKYPGRTVTNSEGFAMLLADHRAFLVCSEGLPVGDAADRAARRSFNAILARRAAIYDEVVRDEVTRG